MIGKRPRISAPSPSVAMIAEITGPARKSPHDRGIENKAECCHPERREQDRAERPEPERVMAGTGG